MSTLRTRSICRDELSLVEISREEIVPFYMQSKSSIKGLLDVVKNDNTLSINGDAGFFRISRPLIYDSFLDLFEDFKKTPNSRRLSIKKGNSSYAWDKIKVGEMVRYPTSYLSKICDRSGFAFLQFKSINWDNLSEVDKSKVNNEIGFELDKDSGRIFSSILFVPCFDFESYGINSSYKKVYGLLDKFEPIGSAERNKCLREMICSLKAGDIGALPPLFEDYNSLEGPQDYKQIATIQKLREFYNKYDKDLHLNLEEIGREYPSLLKSVPKICGSSKKNLIQETFGSDSNDLNV